jgi:anti-sigma regulatory factor (Ser/Thr protein kinase)
MTATELRYELEPSIEGFPAARARFDAWLQQRSIDGTDCEELQVVLSELVANAVEASDPQGAPIEVWVHQQGDHVWVEVSNEAERNVRFPPMPVPPADPLGPTGRGLMIVGAFTDRVAAETIDGRTRVTAVKTLRPAS